MLIEMLKASGVGAGLPETMFDMSVGYDLAGIKSAKVRGFLDGMLDATQSSSGCGRRSPTSGASSATCRIRPASPTR